MASGAEGDRILRASAHAVEIRMSLSLPTTTRCRAARSHDFLISLTTRVCIIGFMVALRESDAHVYPTRLRHGLLTALSAITIGIWGCSADDTTTATGSGAGGRITTGVGGATTSSGDGGIGGGGATGGNSSSSGSLSSSSSSSTTSSSSSGGSSVKVKLIAIGDTGEGNTGQHAVADQMAAKCTLVGGCDAVLVNGDNFYDNGVKDVNDPLWKTAFEEPYDRPALNGVPFYVVLGNHDHGPTSTGNKQAQIDYSSLPLGSGPGMRSSEKWHMPAAWYDVVIGNVHLFATDTVDFLNATQRNDVSGKVAASKATWKIVFGHHPRYTSGEHFFDNQLLGIAGLFAFQKAVYCGADIFMTGHDHDLEFIDKGRDSACPNTHFIISGAGSKTRESFELTPTDSKQIFYTEVIEGFAYLEFEGNKLTFEFIDRNGKVLFTKIMTK